jgi:hypothetical protein
MTLKKNWIQKKVGEGRGEVSLGERHSPLKSVKEDKHGVKNRKVLE